MLLVEFCAVAGLDDFRFLCRSNVLFEFLYLKIDRDIFDIKFAIMPFYPTSCVSGVLLDRCEFPPSRTHSHNFQPCSQNITGSVRKMNALQLLLCEDSDFKIHHDSLLL